MMTKAKGPVWHKKDMEKNIVPERLRGLDKQATWGRSKTDGWVFGHGSFCITSHKIPVLGQFTWMKNSGNEAKEMNKWIRKYKGLANTVCMDSKADDKDQYFYFKHFLKLQLLTRPKKEIKSEERSKMYKEIMTAKNRKIYKDRSITVEPMQGLIANIFELERCWMRGSKCNRWSFAAMGVAVQMAQLNAYKNSKSTWDIKGEVLGL